jgi:hypothetical protein
LIKICSRKSKTVLSALISNLEFRKFTNRKSNNTILPFIQLDNTVILEENSKVIELEETFFSAASFASIYSSSALIR